MQLHLLIVQLVYLYIYLNLSDIKFRKRCKFNFSAGDKLWSIFAALSRLILRCAQLAQLKERLVRH